MQYNDKNVLITGVGGFVGSHLASDLVNSGAQVYGLIRPKSERTIPERKILKNDLEKIEFIEGDLEDLPSLIHAIDISNPDYIFHLAAQTYTPRSISHPYETSRINGMGTQNLLEAIRLRNVDPTMIFAGTSEEYGLVFSHKEQYHDYINKHGRICPEPERIPEVPITENNPLRPLSPYAVSKVFGDFLCRNYFQLYGMKCVVSRAFIHEGIGRGPQFVTSIITDQVKSCLQGNSSFISIGNVNSFRDWSHVSDIIKGYQILGSFGNYGEVYNLGSNRCTSILSYILHAVQALGYTIDEICTTKSNKKFKEPMEKDVSPIFSVPFEKSCIDQMMLCDNLSFDLSDGDIIIKTDKREIPIRMDPSRYRSSDNPILLADISKSIGIGYKVNYSVSDIVKEQMNQKKGIHQ